MREVKQINIKNWTYYFYNNITDLKEFDVRLLKVDKNSYKNIGIYYIGYITNKKIDDYESIYSVNPLYLHIDHASGYIEEKMEINTSSLTLQMKIKNYWKKIMMFGMELMAKKRSKQLWIWLWKRLHENYI